MKELVAQNYNPSSICFWGLSNEVTIRGDSEELLQNLRELNALCKTMDPSRLTTMANVSTVPMGSQHNYISDLVSYNHYFGWYCGSVADNRPRFDAFHEKNPDRAIGCSEYGADARKEAFYICQAYWSAAPMVHACGERFPNLHVCQYSPSG